MVLLLLDFRRPLLLLFFDPTALGGYISEEEEKEEEEEEEEDMEIDFDYSSPPEDEEEKSRCWCFWFFVLCSFLCFSVCGQTESFF